MPQQLSNLHVDEVSLVDRGANGKRWMILKAHEGGGSEMPQTPGAPGMSQEVLDVLTVPIDGEAAAVAKAALAPTATPAAVAALRILKGYAQEIGADGLRSIAAAAGITLAKAKDGSRAPSDDEPDDEDADDEADREAMKSMSEEEKAEYRKARKARRRAAKSVGKSATGLPQPVRKADGSWDLSGVPANVQAIVKAAWDAQDAAAQAQAVAKAERDIRVTREFVTKAQGYDALAIEPEKFGPVMKTISEKAPEVLPQIEAVLAGANEAVSKGALYGERGRSGVTKGSGAMAEIEAAAAALVQKDGNLTKEQAIVKAMEANPDLYARYLRESA